MVTVRWVHSLSATRLWVHTDAQKNWIVQRLKYMEQAKAMLRLTLRDDAVGGTFSKKPRHVLTRSWAPSGGMLEMGV